MAGLRTLAHQVAALEAVDGHLPRNLVEGDREEHLRLLQHVLLRQLPRRLLEPRHHVAHPRVEELDVAPPGGHLAREDGALPLARREVVAPLVGGAEGAEEAGLGVRQRRLEQHAEGVGDH